MKHLRFFIAGLMVFVVIIFARSGLSAASPNERLSNGSFEEGFGVDGVGLNWGTFYNAGAQAIGYYQDSWKPVVYDGQYSQLIEFDTAPATPTPIFSPTPTATNTPTPSPTPTATMTPPPPPPPTTVVHPKGLAIDPERNYLYVTSRDTNSVVIIDEASFTRVATLTGFDRPFDVGIVKRTAYVSEFADGKPGQVGVINMDTLTKTMTIDTAACGASPTHIDVNLNTNRVYVTLHGSAKTAVIDANTNTVIACVDAGSGVFGVTVSSRYNQFYIGNRDTHDLWVYDGATNQLRQKIDLGGSPYYLATSPDGTRLYVAVGAPNPDIVDQLFVYDISATNLVLAAKVKVGNTNDGGWILESQCTGLIYVSATGLLSDGSPGPADRQVWVLNRDLSLNRILTAADGIGSEPFGLAEDPKLGHIYIGAKGSDIVSVINEPSCSSSFLSRHLALLSFAPSSMAPVISSAAVAPLPGRVAGLYQTVALVPGAPYTMTLHGMVRMNPFDANVAKDIYTAQWAIDANGATDWTTLTDWKTIPWMAVYPKLTPGAYLDYTTNFTAPSGKATLFLRFTKKIGTEGIELDVNLDGLSVAGATPDDAFAPAASIVSVPGLPIEGKSYLVRVRASDDVGVTSVTLNDNGARVDARTSEVGALERAAEFVWTPRGAGKHTLQVIAQDASGKSASASQEVNVGAFAEFIQNGDFEDGFAANGVANQWSSFNQGGDLFLRFADLDATWQSVVLHGLHAQTVRVSSPGLLSGSPNGSSGICQTINGLTPGAQYWLTLNGLLHVSDDVSRPSDFANVVQWGYAPGASTGCAPSSVNNWQTVPWNNVTHHSAPGPYNAYAADFVAPSDSLTLFIRLAKSWPAGRFELDLNLDQLSLKGYK